MYPLPRKTTDVADLRPGRAHLPGAPFDKDLIDSFKAVQPEGFGGSADSAVEAGATDPDADDTIGGE